MKEYIALPESVYSSKDALKEWLNHSYNYASSLPPKERKNRSPKK
jgi:TfoX/Sxy family transcriptional regulator of competence genes